MVVKKCNDYLPSLLPLPCLVLRSQQFYPSLLFPHQGKCQPSGTGKECLCSVTNTALTPGTLWKAPGLPAILGAPCPGGSPAP